MPSSGLRVAHIACSKPLRPSSSSLCLRRRKLSLPKRLDLGSQALWCRPYRHRHLRREGLLSSSHAWPAKEESWSGKSSQEENEVNAALFDCVRGYSR